MKQEHRALQAPSSQIDPPSPTTRRPSSDINSPAVLMILLAGALAIVDIVLFVVAFHFNSTRAEVQTQVVGQAYTELGGYRAEQAQKLNRYVRSPNAPGKYTIPIEEAMRLYAAEQTPGLRGAAAAAGQGEEGPTAATVNSTAAGRKDGP
jgi:hypothetical protein